jgi:proline dehydrogenase-like protein
MDIVFTTPPPATPLRAAIRDSYRIDETAAVGRILAAAEIPADLQDRIAARAPPRLRGPPRAARQGRHRRFSA